MQSDQTEYPHMTDLPTLYGAPNSGHSYKVRLALLLTGTAHAYRAVDLALPRGQRDAAFDAASRFGEVPLWLEGGAAHVQSNAILLHLAEQRGVLAGEPRAMREWLFWEANRVGFSVPNLRHARRFAPQPPAVLDWLRARAEADLAVLNARLATADWLEHAGPTVADVACCGYLYWLDQAGLDAARWPAVQAWLARIAALPGWRHPDDALAPPGNQSAAALVAGSPNSAS